MSTVLETFTPKGLGYPTVGGNPLNIQAMVEQIVNQSLAKKISPSVNGVRGMAYNPERTVFKDKDSGAVVKPQTVYAAVPGMEGVPSWKISDEPIPVIDVRKFSQAVDKYASGSIGSDALLYNHIYPDFQEQAINWYRKIASGTVIHSGDFPEIRQAQMLTSLLNIEERTYTIDQSFRTVQSGDILVDIDTYHRFELGGFDMGEFQQVDPSKGFYETEQILMRKAMGSLEYTDEALMMNRRQNVLGDHMQNLVSDFRRIIAKKSANEYTKVTTETLGGGNILAYDVNTERSTINLPLVMGNAQSEIDDAPNNGQGQTWAMHPETWRKALTNSWMARLFGNVATGPITGGVVPGPRGFEGTTIYLDKLLPKNKIFLIDNRYGFIIQGPVMTENSRDSDRGVNKVQIRNWHRIILIHADKFGRFITAT
jgi:hypothetical protein